VSLSTFAARDGTRLAFRTLGSGPPLLCVPGGPGRASAYLEDLGGLAGTRTLVLLDSRGTGASEIPADEATYVAESLGDDVDALREHLGLERADVLGHSAGGKVAQCWAAAHPDRVGRLVLATTFLHAGHEDVLADRERVLALRSGEPWYPLAREAADGLRWAPRGERSRLEREMRPFWYGTWTERVQAHAASADVQTEPRASSRFRTTTPRDELRARLAAVDAPVLVVVGELDAMTPPVAGREVAAAFPRAEVVELRGAGHFPWVDDPDQWLAAVAPFLAAEG
jgi:pimeloyl-ACP methyl ester carboxylesterase